MNGAEQAAEFAKDWCQRNPGWQRFCDIEDTDGLMITWDELPSDERQYWRGRYGDSAESMWDEFSTDRPNRKRFAFIAEDGNFYPYDRYPYGLNIMTVVETGAREAIYYRDGRVLRLRKRKAAENASPKR